MNKPMSKMNVNELREIAVSLGADRKRLYGTSKMSLIIIINRLKREKRKEQQMERRELDSMPYDRDGMHATGYEVCVGDINDPSDWWNEYEDEEGNIYLLR